MTAPDAVHGAVRVLVVEDSRAEYTLTREFLAEADAGYVVDWAPSAADGLNRLRAGDVDVALVDYRLPRSTGVDLIREAVGAGCRVPLILVTGHGDHRIDVEAMEAGAADYLSKQDLTPALLDRAIRYAMRHQRGLDLLRRSEERFRALIENSADGILLIDRDGKIVFASESVRTISGFSATEMVGQSGLRTIHPDDVGLLTDVIRSACEQPGIPVTTTYRAANKDGEWRYREALVTDRLSDPAVAAIVVNYHDVTDRVVAQARQAHLAAVAASADDAIIGSTLDGTIVSWNASAERLYGYTASDMIGRHASVLYPPDRLAEMGALVQRIRRGERVEHFQTDRIRKDGSRVHVSLGIAPIVDDAGRPTGIAAVARDVTRQVAAEAAAREADERARFSLEMARVGLWDTDLVTGQTTWSDSMAAVAGIPLDRFPRTHDEFLELVHPEDRASLREMLSQALSEGGTFRLEYRMLTSDGKFRWHESRGRVLKNGEGAPVRALGVGIDITDRKQLEQQFRQAQKMEAIGHLAGGIAHDFNNMLTAILGYCDLALEEDTPEEKEADLQEIKKAADRAAQLTRQLLAFSRKQRLEARAIDLNQLVADVNNMVERLVGEHIRVDVVKDPGLGVIKADRSQIEQVLMNLIVNARDAMPEGGQIAIATCDVTFDAEYVRQHPGSTAGRHAALSVRDSGCGMSAEVLSHIFEPFFTTKDTGKGTGLGLSTVYGIVKQSGGYIDVISTPGRGSAFTAYFPVVDEKAAAESDAIVPQRRDEPTETILLVEDEPHVRAVMEKTLVQAGYTVLVAQDAHDAIKLEIIHAADPIHLLLSDVVMPRMSGPELAVCMVEHRPDLEVLLVSGFSDRAAPRATVSTERTAFLDKPFTPAELAAKVRERLDRRARTLTAEGRLASADLRIGDWRVPVDGLPSAD